jgi:ABC-type phosphate/phosphonate transport system substrate-binding protein
MDFIKKLIVLVLFTSAMYSQTPLRKIFSFGFESKSLIGTDYVDSKIALRILLREMGEKEDVDIDVLFYDTQDDIIEDFVEKSKLDIIVKDIASYLDNYEKIESSSEFLWTLSTQKNSRYYQNYLIVNKNSNIKSLQDIKGKTLSIKEHDSLGKIWLDKIVLEKIQKSYVDVIGNQKKVSKMSRVVLSVLFGKADFAVVSKETWETMIELNPAIKNKIDVLTQSELIFIPIIGAVRKAESSDNTKQVFLRKFIDTANRIEESVHNKQIRTLIKFEYVYILKRDDLKELFKFYDEYKLLRKKYL